MTAIISDIVSLYIFIAIRHICITFDHVEVHKILCMLTMYSTFINNLEDLYLYHYISKRNAVLRKYILVAANRHDSRQ
jgi:hypothetical protein